MKLAKLILATLAVMFAFGAVCLPGRAAALTEAQIQTCSDTYNNVTYDTTTTAGKNSEAAFKKSNCYSGNSGQCTLGTNNQEVDPNTGKRITVDKVSCTDPAGDAAANAAGAATITDPALSAGGCAKGNCSIVNTYINPAIKLLSVLVGIVAVIAIVVGGMQVSTSAGDPQRAAAGKAHIQKALIGLVTYVLLFAFLQWLIPGGII